MADRPTLDRRQALALVGAATLGGCISIPDSQSPTDTNGTSSDSPTDEPPTATATETLTDSANETGEATESETPGDRTLTIGVLAPQTTFPWAGRGMVRGARLAAERSGSDKMATEIVVGDTEGSPSAARRAYQRLQQDHDVDVTVGGYQTQAVLQLFKPMEQTQTVHVTTGAYGTKLADITRRSYEKFKYHFRTGPLNDTDQGRAAIPFLRQLAADHDVEPIGVMVENSERFDGLARVLREDLPRQVEVSKMKRTSTGTTYWGPNFDQFESAGTRLLFAVLQHTNDAIREWDDGDWSFALGGLIRPLQNPRAPATRDPNQTPSPAAQPDDVNGVFTAVPAASRGQPRWSSFADRYRAAYGAAPPFTAATTHDAVLAVTEVAASLDSWDGERFVERMESYATTNSVMLPELAFRGPDATHVHDPVWAPDDGTAVPAVVQWQDGQQVPIYPDDSAVGAYQSPS